MRDAALPVWVVFLSVWLALCKASSYTEGWALRGGICSPPLSHVGCSYPFYVLGSP